MSRESVLVLRTPDGILFPLPLAGPVSRMLAAAVDIGCVLAVMSLVRGIAEGIAPASVDVARALYILVYFVLSVGYGIGAEWFWRGQTVGKRLVKIRVLDAEGLRLHASQIVLRNLLRPVDMLPIFYLVGGIAMLMNRRAQRLGDLAANTIVVREAAAEEPDLDRLFAGKYNSLREWPHLTARLRQRVSPAHAAVALEAVLRRDRLDPVARLSLFAELAAGFRQLVEFPSEAVTELADEQYVRNVLDIVYRK